MSRNSLAPKPLKMASPQVDSRFKRTMTQLKTGAAKTKAHPPASKKAAEAAKASKGPPNELAAGGKAKQVDKIKEAKEGKPEQSSFLALLRAEIEKVMPKTLGATDNFDQTAQQMKGGLKGNVAEQKEKSTADVSGASKQTPGPAGTAKAAEPLPKEGAPPPPNVDAASGMPAPKTDAEVSQKDGPADVKDEFARNDLDQKSLPKARDPRFDAADQAAKEVNKNAETAPAKYRAGEKTALSAAASKAASATKVGAAQMVGVRSGGNAKVLTRQQQQKAKDEAKRKEVVDKIESIYTATKGRVEAKLNALDGEVNGIFDRGVDAALNAMTKFVNAKIRDYKIRRYLSIPLLGLAAWVKDQFLGLPDEVNAFYEQGRTMFQGLMDALIVRVAKLVEQRLKEAKAEVAKGQAEIKAFVASQPKDLQQVAQQAQADVEGRFKELESGIEEKKNALAQSLAQKYKEGFDKANEALKAIQDANKGLVAGFLEKLGEVIKALLEFKAKLMAILRKGAETIKLILADPLGFLGNLISAVKGGVSAFGANIWTHLKAGFMRWLLGNAPPGIAIPSDFSPASIFKLVLGVLGITYDRMRAKAVKLLGPTAVTVIETLVKYVKALIEGGPEKLWAEVKSDLSNLKDMVIGAFQSWLISTVIQKAIVKIVSMFNPAGAIVQAVMAIVSIVQFVVEKAAQIAEFVSSVIDSIHAIATGSIGGAVKRIETALGNAIPLLIGFLASLVGLGGVAAKIREFVMKVQAKVDAAIDKVLKKIVDTVKKLIGKLKGGKDKKKDGEPGKPGEPATDVKAKAKAAIAAGAGAVKTPQAAKALATRVMGQFRKEGLKTVSITPGAKFMQLKVKVSASPEVEAAVLEIAGTIKVEDLDLTKELTVAGGKANDMLFPSIESDPGKAHAEELLIRAMKNNQKAWRKDLPYDPKNPPPKTKAGQHPNHVTILVSRSPCGRGKKDCSGKLIQFARDTKSNLSIRVMSFYFGKKAAFENSSRSGLERLIRDAKADVQPVDMVAVLAVKGTDLPDDVRDKLRERLNTLKEMLKDVKGYRAK